MGVYTTRSGYNSVVRNDEVSTNATPNTPQDFHWIKDLWAEEYSLKLKVMEISNGDFGASRDGLEAKLVILEEETQRLSVPAAS
ncbi:hypothetical protein F2Q69_00016895 [Brassica cretica]|uniref:Uncharacterized protein n=1 Tax=Brassica cretica TaxID=69181 RepID=A0A8S9R9Y5_BRACR|nr:hypothetical protein F2Q69_00016895 [Brassica cretica]